MISAWLVGRLWSLALVLLPITVAIGFGFPRGTGALAVLVDFDVTFAAVQRGVMRSARETLFTIVNREDKYKSKAFIDLQRMSGSGMAVCGDATSSADRHAPAYTHLIARHALARTCQSGPHLPFSSVIARSAPGARI
jgi:hypothetical protein